MKQIQLDVVTPVPVSDAATTDASVDASVDEKGTVPQQPDPVEKVVSADEKEESARLFFPCNREDALLLLGSLCISEFFPVNSINLAVQPEGIALLSCGLRRSEAELLLAGRPERFPILVEIEPNAASRTPRTVGHGDIIGLTFRTQSEADDFRFRPVDEFDTEAFRCRVEENIFDQEGGPRFSIRDPLDGSKVNIGSIADRLSAGVNCLLALGNAKPICRSEIATFLDGALHAQLSSEEISFMAACEILLEGNTEVPRSKHQSAIVAAFASDESTGPSYLINEVLKQYSYFAGQGSEAPKQISAWADIARDVIKGRIALNGDHLSDDKSVILRAALLGVVIDRIDALSTFLDAEKPSGPKVTTEAAFLVGLKRGLINTSWKQKESLLSLLCALTRIMVSTLVNQSLDLKKIFSISKNETDTTSTTIISTDGVTMAEWTETKVVICDSLSLEWRKELNNLDYEIDAPGRARYSWKVRLSPEQVVEVTRCVSGDFIFPMLRYYFAEDKKVRKKKELDEIFRKREMFWYPATDEAGLFCLSCDLPWMPHKHSIDLIAIKLTEAVEVCIIPKKTLRKRKREST
jgi:hypothetical protein